MIQPVLSTFIVEPFPSVFYRSQGPCYDSAAKLLIWVNNLHPFAACRPWLSEWSIFNEGEADFRESTVSKMTKTTKVNAWSPPIIALAPSSLLLCDPANHFAKRLIFGSTLGQAGRVEGFFCQ